MTYDGGIRVAKYEQGVPWAIGAGAYGVFPDLGTVETQLPRLWLAAYRAVTEEWPD